MACAHRQAPPPPGAEKFLEVEGGGGKLRVSDGGTSGPILVLVHGLGSDLEAWRDQLDHLRASGLRAVAYDQRGHGGSERPHDGIYSIAALAGDLDRVAHALGIQRFVLIGHSLSGAVITKYAGLHPESVAGLVYVDAVGDVGAVPRADVERMLATDATLDATGRRAAYAEMLGPSARPTTRERVLTALERMDPPAFAALRRSMTELSAKEALAQWEGSSVAVEAEEAPSAIRASTVLGIRRVTVPGVSHWLMMDDPGATNAALDDFLAALPPR
jgi:pimeloyl-ACP methyl ester carboxylesterase